MLCTKYTIVCQLYPHKAEKKEEWDNSDYVNLILSKVKAENVIKFLILNLIFHNKKTSLIISHDDHPGNNELSEISLTNWTEKDIPSAQRQCSIIHFERRNPFQVLIVWPT